MCACASRRCCWRAVSVSKARSQWLQSKVTACVGASRRCCRRAILVPRDRSYSSQQVAMTICVVFQSRRATSGETVLLTTYGARLSRGTCDTLQLIDMHIGRGCESLLPRLGQHLLCLTAAQCCIDMHCQRNMQGASTDIEYERVHKCDTVYQNLHMPLLYA